MKKDDFDTTSASLQQAIDIKKKQIQDAGWSEEDAIRDMIDETEIEIESLKDKIAFLELRLRALSEAHSVMSDRHVY